MMILFTFFLNLFLIIRIMHVLCTGSNCVARDNFPLMMSETIKVFYYYYLLNFIILFQQENAMTDMSVVVDLLKHSSCLGNHNATYMLSVIYNNGIGVKTDQTQVWDMWVKVAIPLPFTASNVIFPYNIIIQSTMLTEYSS